MKKVNRILIIGHFGGNENFLDGQTIKTKLLYDELTQNTEWEIYKVDTYLKNKRPLLLIYDSIKKLIQCNNIIVLLSSNGIKIYFPILYVFTILFNKNIFHDVIGGSLEYYVKRSPLLKLYMNSFRVNWVETEYLKNKLVNFKINNCNVLPNFKKLNILSEEDLNFSLSEPYRFCTFSRVIFEKGIEDAIKVIEEINFENNKITCVLDIYGQIDEKYMDRFKSIIHLATPAINYKGSVPYDRSVETLRNYHALLFPTFWGGECFPGTFIDAFSAGLPIIATDWKSNSEIVVNNVNGIIYSSNIANNLKESIYSLINNPDHYVYLKRNSLKSAEFYSCEKQVNRIIEFIQKY